VSSLLRRRYIMTSLELCKRICYVLTVTKRPFSRCFWRSRFDCNIRKGKVFVPSLGWAPGWSLTVDRPSSRVRRINYLSLITWTNNNWETHLRTHRPPWYIVLRYVCRISTQTSKARSSVRIHRATRSLILGISIENRLRLTSPWLIYSIFPRHWTLGSSP